MQAAGSLITQSDTVKTLLSATGFITLQPVAVQVPPVAKPVPAPLGGGAAVDDLTEIRSTIRILCAGTDHPAFYRQ